MSKFNNTHIRAGFNDWIDANYEQYEIDKQEAFIDYFEDESSSMTVDEMDAEWYQGVLDTFTFKDIDDWANDAYENYVSGIADAAYDEYKDKQLEENYDS